MEILFNLERMLFSIWRAAREASGGNVPELPRTLLALCSSQLSLAVEMRRRLRHSSLFLGSWRKGTAHSFSNPQHRTWYSRLWCAKHSTGLNTLKKEKKVIKILPESLCFRFSETSIWGFLKPLTSIN